MKKSIVLILIITLSACSSTNTKKIQKPECLTPDYKGFRIEWGYIDNKNNFTTGYSLNEDMLLQMFIQNSNETKYDTICYVEPQQLCNALKLYMLETFKIPVVYESGEQLTFIRLFKPAVDYRSNAIWSKHNTFASTGYRNVFDSLMTLVKIPEK